MTGEIDRGKRCPPRTREQIPCEYIPYVTLPECCLAAVRIALVNQSVFASR